MARKKRTMPGVNATSTADIAFMLLIFFLTTTSMNTDKGLARRLPPPPDPNVKEQSDIIVKNRNILQVRINKDNALMVGSEYMEVSQLKEKAKEFIANPNDDANLPENSGSKRYYLQSAFNLATPEKDAQERRPFQKVNDSFKKIILVRDNIKIRRDESGIVTMGILDFLLNPNSLEL